MYNQAVLHFLDETWQKINGLGVGALGAVAIPQGRYNSFCREIWRIKRDILGANELSECEIRGKDCFAKAAFARQSTAGHSRLLRAAGETLAAVGRHKGATFAIWTTHEEWMMRSPRSTALSPPYRKLVGELVLQEQAVAQQGEQGIIFLNNRSSRGDLSAACAVHNFIAWLGAGHFMQVPHFTPSAVSPGIQAADLVAYLAAHRDDPTHRPELRPSWETVESLAFINPLSGQKALKAVD